MGGRWVMLGLVGIWACASAAAQPCLDGISTLRSTYQDACADFKSVEVVEGFIAVAENWADQCPTAAVNRGFVAAAGLMSAGLPWNPITAWGRFNDWQPELEASIAEAPENPDLRFLRLGVQLNVPAIVGYSGEIDGDLALIEKALNSGHWRQQPAYEAFVRETVRNARP